MLDTSATPQHRNTVTPAVKLFVLLHLAAITVYSLPNPPREVVDGKRRPGLSDRLLVWNQEVLKPSPPVQGYLLTVGFWQYWDMFAPNPAQIDRYGTAQVIYQDGTTKLYRYPRIRDFPIILKYPKERYRKFFERVNVDTNPWIWPTFAQRIAAINTDDPANPPIRVRLYRHWLPVAPPGHPQPTEYRSYMFYEGDVNRSM